jgi:hypothetical protein
MEADVEEEGSVQGLHAPLSNFPNGGKSQTRKTCCVIMSFYGQTRAKVNVVSLKRIEFST